MNAMPPDSLPQVLPAHPVGQSSPVGTRQPDELGARWTALHDAAAIVAGLAGRVDELPEGAARSFPAAIRQASGQRLAVARQGMDDLSAMLETGLRALLSLHGRGADPRPAAQALWHEFAAARDALVALAPPERRLLG